MVHLLRHGEVHNPEGILYGRAPGYHLSELGTKMAERVAEEIAGRDIAYIGVSPLERAQETAAPLAAKLGIEPVVDDRLIESENFFAGKKFEVGSGLIRNPQAWHVLWNPWRPSWGEPYKKVAARMMAAVHDARRAAEGREAVVVSHQLPIWTTRLHAEGRSYLHDPRKRQCTLCSLTSLTFEGDDLVSVGYSEPVIDLVPVKARKATFSAGDRAEDKKS